MFVPAEVLARHVPPLKCYYCAESISPEHGDLYAHRETYDPRKTAALITIHDQRGCAHVCFGHAKWRMERSWAHGHSPDCPYHRP